MVTQKEYEDFQNNNDRQHPLNPDGTPVSTRVTPQDYTLWQNHWSRDVEIPDDPPAGHRHPTQKEYEDFQNSFGRVSEPEPRRVPYSMRPSRPQGTYTGRPMTQEEIAENERLTELSWKQFYDEDEDARKLSLEEYEKVLKQREIQEQKEAEERAEREKRKAERAREQKRIKSNPLLRRLDENAYGGKEAQERRKEKLRQFGRKQFG